MRRYVLSKIANIRDIGGYAAIGGETAYGKFIRSGVPIFLSVEDKVLLKSLNLTDVIDLRSADEIKRIPNAFHKLEDISVHHIAFLSDEGAMPKSDDEIAPLYLGIAENPSMLRVMHVFLKAKGAVLFHCMAGKDRTGTTAALLQLLAGVSDQDIMADYILSQAYMLESLKKFTKEYSHYPMGLIIPKIENIYEFLKLFHAKYKLVENYFEALGLSGEEIKKLKKLLVVQ